MFALLTLWTYGPFCIHLIRCFAADCNSLPMFGRFYSHPLGEVLINMFDFGDGLISCWSQCMQHNLLFGVNTLLTQSASCLFCYWILSSNLMQRQRFSSPDTHLLFVLLNLLLFIKLSPTCLIIVKCSDIFKINKGTFWYDKMVSY